MKTLLALLILIPSLSFSENWQYLSEGIYKNEKIIYFYDKDSISINVDDSDEIIVQEKNLFINQQKFMNIIFNNERYQTSINCRDKTWTNFRNGVYELWMDDKMVFKDDSVAIPSTKLIKAGNYKAFLYRILCLNS